MSIKLTFEIGHSASRKTKPSKEGFTHDWELFVRGCDGNEIGHFVEKVVFNLHESFPKPKRVIKEPPYTVKEAGYAGFVLKIDIYLKNRDEPKKVTFEYDLDLQPIKKQLNEITIQNPADDFKRKCLKGGGVLQSTNDYKNRDSYGKSAPSQSQSDIKKSSKRPEDAKPTKTFTDLFGAPLKKNPIHDRTHRRIRQNYLQRRPAPRELRSLLRRRAPAARTKVKSQSTSTVRTRTGKRR